MADYTNKVIINMEDDRTRFYMDSNYNDITEKITSVASEIRDILGVYPFEMDLPVLRSL